MLSQSEIDALLSGTIEMDQKDTTTMVNLADLMVQPNEPKRVIEEHHKKIQVYNFWSPDRFSKEQMRALELIHEDLAERLTTSLPAFLRTNLRPRLVHNEQGRFHDFIKEFPPNTLFHMINMVPLPSQMVVTLSPNICYMILEQRLGGKIEGTYENHVMTEIDQSLLRGMVEHMLGDIKAAWSKMVTLDPALEDSTTNQNWVHMMLGNERVMLMTMELTIQGVVGTMNFFIPFPTLKPIASVLNPHFWIAGRKEPTQDPVARQTALANLSKLYLPIIVTLGEVDLKFSDILNIGVGDVIRLDTRVEDSVTVKVGVKKQFTAHIGKSGRHLAVQISSVIAGSEASSKEYIRK
jgi:flagellar motor switch protein FliM